MYRVDCPPGGIAHSKDELLSRDNTVVLTLTLRNDTEERHLRVQNMTFRDDPSRKSVLHLTSARARETDQDGRPISDEVYDLNGWLTLELTDHGTVVGEVEMYPVLTPRRQQQ
jgi:hypothetical protein